MSILNRLKEDLKMIFLTETKRKIRFISVGVNCKKKWGEKMAKKHLKLPFGLFDTLPNYNLKNLIFETLANEDC